MFFNFLYYFWDTLMTIDNIKKLWSQINYHSEALKMLQYGFGLYFVFLVFQSPWPFWPYNVCSISIFLLGRLSLRSCKFTY